LDFWKSYARDVCPSIFFIIIIENKLGKFQEFLNLFLRKLEAIYYIRKFLYKFVQRLKD